MKLILFFTHATDNKIQMANSPPVVYPLQSPSQPAFQFPRAQDNHDAELLLEGALIQTEARVCFLPNIHYTSIDFEMVLPEFTTTLDTEFTLAIPAAEGIMVPYCMSR